MGTRRDNRTSVVGPGPTAATGALHSKLRHEKRNQELMKERMVLASVPPSDTTKSAKTVMSKSLTSENGDKDGNSLKSRRKADLDKSLKSFQRQTSSSAMKQNGSSNEKDTNYRDNRMSRSFGDDKSSGSRTRDSSPVKGRGISQGAKDSRQGSKTRKSSDVFERLSRQDTNKSENASSSRRRSESNSNGGGNLMRDRDHSLTKTGRKSLQEKSSQDKHLITTHKTKSGDLLHKNTQLKRRDNSPVKKESNVINRKNRSSLSSSSSSSLSSPLSLSPSSSSSSIRVTRDRTRVQSQDEFDKDSSTEKLIKDNVPESPDKDLQDSISVVGDYITGVQDSISPQSLSSSNSTVVSTKEIQSCRAKTTDKRKDLNADCIDEHISSKLLNKSEQIQNISKRKNSHAEGELVPVLSKDQVMQKVRERVAYEDSGKKDTKGAVIDDDKDVCEDEKCDEEDEFYKIKVQTRLVSYSNNTLVIKNTSKSKGVTCVDVGVGSEDDILVDDDFTSPPVIIMEAGGQAKDTIVTSTECASSCTTTTTTTSPSEASLQPEPIPASPNQHHHTLQTSSVALPAVAHNGDVEGTNRGAIKGIIHDDDDEEEELSSLTRSQSIRRKFSQFVCKSKIFLSDVYSATQNKLEQYAQRVDEPLGNVSLDQYKKEGISSDEDSGYYSFGVPPPDMTALALAYFQGPTRADSLRRVPSYQGPYQGYPTWSSYPVERVDTPTNEMSVSSNSVKTDVSEESIDPEEVALPDIPPPHFNFKLNEDWIKKNILCTCKCTKNKTKGKVERDKLVGKDESSQNKCLGNGDIESEVVNTEQCKQISGVITDINVQSKHSDESIAIHDTHENVKYINDENCNETDTTKSCDVSKETVDNLIICNKEHVYNNSSVSDVYTREPLNNNISEIKSDVNTTKSYENTVNSDVNTIIKSETQDLPDTDDVDDLCFCSCHDGERDQQLQQFPQEVQDLLDADHARMWWTITGNFGNILPIDWSKSYTRQKYLPVLNLNETKESTGTTPDDNERNEDGEEEEEEVAQDLDLHHLILNGLSQEPVKSAEEVIKEIDDIMQEGSSSEDEGLDDSSPSTDNGNDHQTHPLPPPLYAEKLNSMSIGELNESLMELEVVIQRYSETLINQLALRDELEFEKELKNSFISLLLQVQNKRRNFNVEKKKQKKVGPNGIDPKYLTTVIPYDVGHGPPQNETLQILIKILMAINEDSPTVPTLLTDYILKVLCPS